VHHHGIAGRIKVNDGGLSEGFWKHSLGKLGDIGRELGRLFSWIDAVRPIVLASERHPVKLAFYNLLDGQGFVELGLL
jgi:hypothetical protein